MRIYKLTTFFIGIDSKIILEHWKSFLYSSKQKCNIKIEILNSTNCKYGIEEIRMPECINKCFNHGESYLLADRQWKNYYVLPHPKSADMECLLVQAFYTYAVQRHMLQFHSSLISHQNSGIMFLGPSGIGKTTQAELWNQYRDALIINGDIVFVQETEKEFLGWGTPWHGSSPYCENTSVPLRAMVVLKQAKENSIRELTGFEKVSEVSNHVFYPQWLENGMELCLETLDHLLTAIPVYELSCRPDEDAVRLTEETIFGI